MKIRLVTLAAAVLLTANAGKAQTTTTTTTTTVTTHVWEDPNAWWGSHWVMVKDNRYNCNELSLDFFGSYLANEKNIENVFKHSIRHGTWGGGVGANYFFTRELGVGVDANIPANDGNFVDSVNGSLIARFPITTTGLAPYVFGGGGRQTDPAWQWTGHAGVGLEYRFNPGTGVFADTRYTWADKTSDTILFRAGLRFLF